MSVTDQDMFSFYNKDPLFKLLTAVTVARHLFHRYMRKLRLQTGCVCPAVPEMNDHIRIRLFYRIDHIIHISVGITQYKYPLHAFLLTFYIEKDSCAASLPGQKS